MKFEITPIAFVRSCFQEKFATPRQPGLVTAATGSIELLPPFNDADTVSGLENCSHIWLQFVFHQCIDQGWKAKVRPPRLGGNKKMGVFATRATHRPNALGLSVVKLESISTTNNQVILNVSGLDLIDGTPIVDIKPYIPYSDSLTQAHYPFAQEAPKQLTVVFTDPVQSQLKKNPNLKQLIEQVLAQDPKPAFHRVDSEREYGAKLAQHNVKWRYLSDGNEVWIEVCSLELIR